MEIHQSGRGKTEETEMRTRWKIALGLAGVPLVAAAGLAFVVELRWDRTFDVEEPVIRASREAAVIDRGRYLAYGPAHCSYCHTPLEDWPRLDAGEELPMSGGMRFELPLGTLYTPNLTPDEETGIGRWTDGQLARMLRHGVRHDGRAAVPFMEFQNLSDEDVLAIVSYLRTQPPVRKEVPRHDINFVGRALSAFLFRPVPPEGTPPALAPEEAPTVERGRYLADRVAACGACHTQRNLLDGAYIGPRYAGGHVIPMDDNPRSVFVTPNLTPDPETGHIAAWTEEQFVARFRVGRIHAGSHMPWASFARMSDDDLRAIFRYLRSLEPVHNATGALIQNAP
jgi:mono/diheme cytochrome c family protein